MSKKDGFNLILSTEYSPKFDEIRKNMVKVSFYKYGPIKKNIGEGRVDAIASARRKIARYEETGNTEFLADAANYLMFGFMYPMIPGAKYTPTDQDPKSRPVGTPINMERGEL